MSDLASSSSSSIPATTVETYACAAGNIDPTTGACSAPVWIVQPSMLPPLDAGSGITIAVAILACWAIAYGFRAMRRAGD